MKKFLFIMAMAISTLSVSAQKNNTIDTLKVTTTPQMHCSGCENKIKSNLRFVKGMKKIETSVEKQQVTVIYDKKKSNYETIVAAFKKIGYEIKPVGKKKINN